MSWILSIYSTNAFKEVLLPAINNADTSIIIDKDIFVMPTDIEIPLEIIENKWYIRNTQHLDIRYTISKDYYNEECIVDRDLLTIYIESHTIINLVVREVKDSFRVYKKYNISKVDSVTIGKSENADFCYDTQKLISREHGIIRNTGGYFVMEDKSANGIFINSRRMNGIQQLFFGDCIDIFGLRLVFLGSILAVNEGIEGLRVKDNVLCEYQGEHDNHPFPEFSNREEVIVFHRSPRKIYKIESDTVEIEAPPAPKEENRQPLTMMIGPSMTMALPMVMGSVLSIYGTQMSGRRSGIFMYTGLVTAISSALIGVMWSLINLNYSRKKNRKEELHRFEAYSEYLINCANCVKEKYEKNTTHMREMYPSAEICCGYNHQTSVLWDRNPSHSDFLFQRLGTGSIPFQVKIDIPKEKFSMINDSLAEKPKMIKESYAMMHDVPIGVDLLVHPLIGAFGGVKKSGAIAAVYNIVAQIVANNCYTDVKLVFIYDEKDYEGYRTWEFTRWLPHVWSEDKKTRFVAKNKSEASDVLYELTKVLRMRAEESERISTKKNKIPKPYYVMFIANPELLDGELVAKYVFTPKAEYGLTTILIEEEYNKLPNTCGYIIQNDNVFQGVYGVAEEEEKHTIQFDIVNAQMLEKMSRVLSNITVSETEIGGEIPNSLTFFEMYGVNRLEELNVLDRWRKNRTYESMKALIGQKSGGVDYYLDVHEKYHGPHGLVAGTTGSGKSETLQTYMLSLALNFSPDDIGFFIIDYKGGGMANLFSGLPHLIGQISNLSGNQVRRAMVSIKSENIRRQRLFNEHGVNNINLYTKLYKNNEASEPIPHLFIIIDEFAELKREEPDFMKGLISVAQVGRSLGVHLILATQKPSGTVDENIWSNSKFKLCLRVQDRQDSMDMLHKPDAAYITQAGRCYLQVGNDELYELFQSGYSGAVYDESTEDMKTDIARMISTTGKAALVGSRVKLKQREALKIAWIRQLTDIIREVYDGEAALDFETRDKIIDKIYEIIKERNVEYPYSEYNVRRMEDLLMLYHEEREPKQIIALASVMGKKLPEIKEKTQLDAVVEYLGKVAKENGYTHNLQLWMPVLPQKLYLDELEGYNNTVYQNGMWPELTTSWTLSVYMGLCDDPVNQAQMPMVMDLAINGHHAVCGTVVSGKSTFLQTFVYSLINKYSPDAVNVYGLDFGSKMLSAFEDAPHIGGIVYDTELDKVDKLINLLERSLEERKTLFRSGNYSQYVQANGVVLPAIILVIDNFANFRNKTNNRYDEFFIRLSKEGVGYGVFIIVTAAGFGAAEIPNRMGDNIRTTISLEMGDKFQYADVMRVTRVEIIPEENIKGRGLIRVGESLIEYQTALALRAEDDFKRAELITQCVEQMRTAWKGKCASPIPQIPKTFTWSVFCETEDFKNTVKDDRILSVGYLEKTVQVYGIDLSENYCYLVTGKNRSGKTNFLKIAIASAVIKKFKVVIFDFAGEYKTFADRTTVTYISDDAAMFRYFNEELSYPFRSRNIKKRKWVSEGCSDKEIFENMADEEKILHFIGSLPEFLKHMYKPAENIGAMSGFIETLFEKGSFHNVYWFAILNPDDAATLGIYKAYTLFAKYKKGIHFGGNVAEHRIFNFDYLSFAEKSKAEKQGVALLPSSADGIIGKVVIPLYKAEAAK